MTPRLSLCAVVAEGGHFLVGRRKPGGSQGGKWEFPGGKQEAVESAAEALTREFQEELAVQIDVGRRLYEGEFRNGRTLYRLEAWEARLVTRDFRLREHVELRWADAALLDRLDLSDSDRQVVRALSEPVARSGQTG